MGWKETCAVDERMRFVIAAEKREEPFAALCRRFSIGGYHVLIAGRTAAKIDQVAATIVSSGGSATPIVIDATKEEDIVALFDRAMAPRPRGSAQ